MADFIHEKTYTMEWIYLAERKGTLLGKVILAGK